MALSLFDGIKFGVSALLPGGVPLDDAVDYLFSGNYTDEEKDNFYSSYGFGDPVGKNKDLVDEIVSVVTPNSSDSMDSSYKDTIVNSINDAVNEQNIASQNSADKAMEFTAEQNRIDREFQAQQAQKAMDYQTEMSNTAYQRAMADMKAAGLNPKLVGQLGGASSPSGVAASGTGGGQGTSASMSMANTSALAGVLETYISSATSLDKGENDFVQNTIRDLFKLALEGNPAAIAYLLKRIS